MALVTLACSIGILSQDDPFYTPPGGNPLWTPTPILIFPGDDMGGDPTSTPAVVSLAPGDGVPIGGIGDLISPTAQVDSTPEGNEAPFLYETQAGDTLPVVALRFGVKPEEIYSPEPLPATSLLVPNQLLLIPKRLANTTSSTRLLPDSEVIFSASGENFDPHTFIQNSAGYLSTYREWLGSTQWTSGADIIQRVALENSINPRLLISLLEYQGGWVYGQPIDLLHTEYPLGHVEQRRKGLYAQLTWAVNQLSIGYYGWREGLLTEIEFSDGASARLAPGLNAGSVALQYYFAQVYDTNGWVKAIDPASGLAALHERMFESPWIRALDVEPLYPPDLTQPELILPFLIGQVWSYSGGPHGAWEHDGARAALDFAPSSTEAGCAKSDAWVLASAPGLVTRAKNAVVVIDLDGDGIEQTGWVLLYLHLENIQVRVGDHLETGDLLGHPSCEGGFATGTHIHIARKYNGEWIAADGPLPFMLSGWRARAGAQPYEGELVRDGKTIPASVYGSYESRIVRDREEP